MSTRWMAVQYVGDILRIPVANESDMSMPFGSSTLERDVRRIVANPFSDSPQVFVPEDENAKLRELVRYMWDFSCVVPDEPHTSKEELDYSCEVWKRMRELGIEVDE